MVGDILEDEEFPLASTCPRSHAAPVAWLLCDRAGSIQLTRALPLPQAVAARAPTSPAATATAREEAGGS